MLILESALSKIYCRTASGFCWYNPSAITKYLYRCISGKLSKESPGCPANFTTFDPHLLWLYNKAFYSHYWLDFCTMFPLMFFLTTMTNDIANKSDSAVYVMFYGYILWGCRIPSYECLALWCAMLTSLHYCNCHGASHDYSSNVKIQVCQVHTL